MYSMNSVSLSLQCPHGHYISCSTFRTSVSPKPREYLLSRKCFGIKDVKSLVGKFSPIGKLMLLLWTGWVHVGHCSWSCQFPKA